MNDETLNKYDRQIVAFYKKHFSLIARVALFVIYFWFGFLKIMGLSPATPLAAALTTRTVGAEYFGTLFYLLAIVECVIGLLFLFPKYTRLALLLMLDHMMLVISPLVIIPDLTWSGFFVPTLEGQYIIKNIALIALAIGISTNLEPIKTKKSSKK